MEGKNMGNLQLKQELDARQLAIVQSEFENQKKSMVVAYLLWFFLGGLGGHRFYVGKPVSALMMTGLWVLGFITVWIFIGYFFFFIVYVWVFIDAFLLHGIINKINQKTERKILERVSST